MKLVGIYSIADSAQPEMNLGGAGIKYEKRMVADDCAEHIHLYVNDADFEKAAELLENLESALNADVDLSVIHYCPWCGSNTIAWRREVANGSEVDKLYCVCGEGNPVAMRNPLSKRGGILEKPN